MEAVKRFHEALGCRQVTLDVGETVLFPAGGMAPTFWGGYTGVFVGPDGHTWEVAHNPGFPLADDGSLMIPPTK